MVMAPIDRIRPLPLPKPVKDPVDSAVFAMLDGDGDGKISQDEWKKAGWADERLALFDENGDGKVCEKEFHASRRLEREFNGKDASGDGSLSRFEFLGLRPYLLADKVKGSVADVLGGAKKLGGDLVRHFPFPIKDRFQSFDTNNDGKVSKEEFFAGRRKEQAPPIWRPRPLPAPWPDFPIKQLDPKLLAKAEAEKH